mmetsp:Transcript_52325/g.147311  ORF Transcript_52325/g.147311 Transcript_52325/m.147311 type:complete len:227 (-) Transcript_52325:2612-3292(-)
MSSSATFSVCRCTMAVPTAACTSVRMLGSLPAAAARPMARIAVVRYFFLNSDPIMKSPFSSSSFPVLLSTNTVGRTGGFPSASASMFRLSSEQNSSQRIMSPVAPCDFACAAALWRSTPSLTTATHACSPCAFGTVYAPRLLATTTAPLKCWRSLSCVQAADSASNRRTSDLFQSGCIDSVTSPFIIASFNGVTISCMAPAFTVKLISWSTMLPLAIRVPSSFGFT